MSNSNSFYTEKKKPWNSHWFCSDTEIHFSSDSVAALHGSNIHFHKSDATLSFIKNHLQCLCLLPVMKRWSRQSVSRCFIQAQTWCLTCLQTTVTSFPLWGSREWQQGPVRENLIYSLLFTTIGTLCFPFIMCPPLFAQNIWQNQILKPAPEPFISFF